jgi:deazaflavin-dependent oxidoreductase (nitroreductase family)
LYRNLHQMRSGDRARLSKLGRWVNRFQAWWSSSVGLPPHLVATLEVRGRKSGEPRANPIVLVTLDEQRYLVSMLGPGADWVKNVEAAEGAAVLRQGSRRRVQFTLVDSEHRAPILTSTCASR